MSGSDGGPQRTIDELILRYRLEPELFDVVVEGSDDVAFFEWFLGVHGRDRPRVVSIDAVHVPGELVRALDLDIGNRGRVIALADALGGALDVPKDHCLCIADADRLSLSERSLDRPTGSEVLLFTDVPSLESYAFTEPCLAKLFSLVLHIRPRELSAAEVIDGLAPALADVAFLRCALHELNTGCAIIDKPQRCCERVGSAGMSVDIEELARRCLQGAASGRLAEVLDMVASLRANTTIRPTEAVHGHDLAWALSFVLGGRIREPGLRRPRALEGALIGCLDQADLVRYPLFDELLRRT